MAYMMKLKHLLLYILLLSFSALYAEIESNNYSCIIKNFENEYGIKVYYDYGSYYFPRKIYQSPLLAQIDPIKENISVERILRIVNKAFSTYPRHAVFNKFDAIYLSNKIRISNNEYSIFSLGRGLYVADSSNNEKVSETEIEFGIHKELNSILFNNYPNLISETTWSLNNLKDNIYNNVDSTISTDSLHLLGFLDYESTNNVFSDFITFAVWHHTNKSKLDSIENKYPSIKAKHKKYINILSDFEEGSLKISKREIQKVSRIEDKYGITLNYNYSIDFFPSLWCLNPIHVTAKQIDEKKIDASIALVQQFLSMYDDKLIKSTINNIYLVDDLKVRNTSILCFKSVNSIYISADSLLIEGYSSKYIEKLVYTYSGMLLRNFYTFFPKEEWTSENQGSNNSLTEKILQTDKFSIDELAKNQNDSCKLLTFYIINKDKIDNLYSEDTVIFKKINIIKAFYKNINTWVLNAYLNEDIINKKVIEIFKKYHIRIIYDLKNTDNTVLPPTLRYNEPMNFVQTYRYINIIDSVIKTYSKVFLSKELTNIYLIGSMNYYNSLSDAGGTYEEFSSSIYLSNIGNSDDYLRGILFHEFCSILLYRYMEIFPINDWIALNPNEFKYASNGINPDKDWFDTGEDYYNLGFINNYATTKFEDDYAELANWYFSHDKELKEIIKNHESLKMKHRILKNFYEQIF